MSLIGNALNNWLQRQNTSVLRQATVCEAIPPHTRERMITISVDSAAREELGKPAPREKGCPITHDYTLGAVRTGTRDRVLIPRPEGTIGTYHTHPFGWARPSTYDIIDAIGKNDKVMCIGATGKIGTKIACFTPEEPTWSELKDELNKLDKDIALFNMRIGGKYTARGIRLRNLLKVSEPEAHKEGVVLERRRQELLDGLNMQLLNLGYKGEWRPQEKVNGWQAIPLMMDSCRIIWEGLEEELPAEW